MRSLILCLLVFGLNAEARGKSKLLKAAHQAWDEATVQMPKDQETCFAPDEPCGVKLKRFILSAKETLDIAIFDLNEAGLLNAVIEQSKKIKVRVLLDKKQASQKHGKLSLLRDAKVEIRFGRQPGIMHNKFTIVDHLILETGSFNYTNGAAYKNQENQIYLSSPAVVGRYEARFEKMWKSAKQ